MKEFFKDYKDLCDKQTEFTKKHWKGMALVYVVTLGVTYGWLVLTDRRDKKEIEDWKRQNMVDLSEEEA